MASLPPSVVLFLLLDDSSSLFSRPDTNLKWIDPRVARTACAPKVVMTGNLHITCDCYAVLAFVHRRLLILAGDNPTAASAAISTATISVTATKKHIAHGDQGHEKDGRKPPRNFTITCLPKRTFLPSYKDSA
jgi:hypothetical protein